MFFIRPFLFFFYTACTVLFFYFFLFFRCFFFPLVVFFVLSRQGIFSASRTFRTLQLDINRLMEICVLFFVFGFDLNQTIINSTWMLTRMRVPQSGFHGRLQNHQALGFLDFFLYLLVFILTFLEFSTENASKIWLPMFSATAFLNVTKTAYNRWIKINLSGAKIQKRENVCGLHNMQLFRYVRSAYLFFLLISINLYQFLQ